MFLPFVPPADLQRALHTNSLQGCGAASSVQLSQKNPPVTTVHVGSEQPPWSDERLRPSCTTPPPAAAAAADLAPADAAPRSHAVPDVFQLAPFKTPGTTSSGSSSGSCSSVALQTVDASDVFLQAPFGKKRETSAAGDARFFKPVTPGVQRCHLVPVQSVPAPQQAAAVHRVVSRVGQQAAVGSVAVGPLHSWAIAGRSVDDPFTAAPFQPRFSQGKP